MKRAIRMMIKCPLQKRFVKFNTCAFKCRYNCGYDKQFSMNIWCSYPTLRKGKI